MLDKEVKFIDLFAGIGGTRIGFENACKKLGLSPKCVFTSEIKPHAIDTYKENFMDAEISGDISQINSSDIPDFDFLLAGFPCQPFSSAGNRLGFMDTRGTLFFEVERILNEKKPKGFLLENVEGLVNHDKVDKNEKIGRTLDTIIKKLENLGYKVTWELLNAKDFGVAQSRKRVYILGTSNESVQITKPQNKNTKLKDILEKDKEPMKSKLATLLLNKFTKEELYGKAIKDKRGGKDNIHSWEVELKGAINEEQKKLLEEMLKERRKKHWAEKKGIIWMDGMPLTLEEIYTFYNHINLNSLENLLQDLVTKDYLKYEHPKNIVEITTESGKIIKKRDYDITKPKGYNIVTGKLSFDIAKILNPNDIAPTLVATDVIKLAVIDTNGLRRLTKREGLRLFGFPEYYNISLKYDKAFDLLGNTVVVPVIEWLSMDLLQKAFIKAV